MLRTWARVCTVNSCCALGHIPAKLKVLGKPAASGAELIRRVFPFPSCSWAGRAHKAIWSFALWIGVSYIWIWGLEVDPEEKVGKSKGLLGVFFFLPWVGNVLIGLLRISVKVMAEWAREGSLSSVREQSWALLHLYHRKWQRIEYSVLSTRID